MRSCQPKSRFGDWTEKAALFSAMKAARLCLIRAYLTWSDLPRRSRDNLVATLVEFGDPVGRFRKEFGIHFAVLQRELFCSSGGAQLVLAERKTALPD
jgi:hypothetical protein